MHKMSKHFGFFSGSIFKNDDKFADIFPLSTEGPPPELQPETEESSQTIPLIRQEDNPTKLPKYTIVLSKNSDDGVTMDDLDGLQQDLEKLLSNCAKRIRYLKNEIESIDKVEDRKDKKGKTYEKTSLKSKRDDRLKHKNGTRIIRKHYNVNLGEASFRQDVPKLILPKNDTSEKFWASIEPFCSDIQKDDVVFLDGLIEEFEKDKNIRIPELGEHYAREWADNVFGDEQNTKSPKMRAVNQELKKTGMSIISEVFTALKPHHCLTIEQRILPVIPIPVDNDFNTAFLQLLKNSNVERGRSTCMDKCMRRELVKQGILSIDDLHKTPPDDEILTEIKKIQRQLLAVNKYNLDILSELKSKADKDLKRLEVRNELEKCDMQVLELYKKMIQIKQKVQQSQEDEDCDKEEISGQLEEFECEADTLLHQQLYLEEEHAKLTDFSLIGS